MTKYVTILDLALHRGAQKDEEGRINGAEFDKVGLAIMGGCGGCNASLAAYNAYPSKSGYWMCVDCLGGNGWTDVEQCDRDLLEAELALAEAESGGALMTPASDEADE